MPRRKAIKKRVIVEDAIYNSKLVNMVINKILLHGKKNIAQKILYDSMKKIKDILKKDPIEVLEKAVLNVTPIIELKSRRVGGATYQVPVEIKADRRTGIGLRLLIKSARKRTNLSFVSKLTSEIIDAYNNTGNAVRRKDELHKMAEANKAFASFKF